MFTLKQVQAFVWVARLGTLQRAADKLHITQSAVTKRLQELTAKSAAPLFEQAARRATLTNKGREILAQCERLLGSVERLDEVQRAEQRVARVVRIGVTELVVLTWFPAFVRQMREDYPDITLLPDIDLSVPLRDKVLDGRLDLAILPEPELPASMARVELGRAPFAWFGPPGLFAVGRRLPLHELASLSIIEQTTQSVITAVSSRMFEAAGANPNRLDGGNNVLALSGLIEAGVGVSCLPVALFSRHVEEGRLQMLDTEPAAPAVAYCATFLKHPHSSFGYAAADIARQCCDFNAGTRAPAARA